MPVCTGGSQPKAGVPAQLVIDPRVTVSTLTPGLQWINPFLPFLPQIVIDTTAFCGEEPPGNPTLDATDFLDLLDPSKIGLAVLAATKLEQLIKNYVWYSLCQCTVGGTPAPPTAPTEPVGTPVINPPTYFPLPGAGPCLVRSTGPISPILGYSIFIPLFPIPTPGPTRLIVTITYQAVGSVHDTQLLSAFDCYNASGAALGSVAFGVSTAGTSMEVTLLTGTHSVQLRQASNQVPDSADLWTTRMDFYCDGTDPNTPYDPCCPPDPALVLAIKRLELLVQLVQRQAVPFAYVPGDLHTGISGAGELAVTGLIGARVTITATYPSTIGSAAGNPERLFGAGYVQWGSADGFTARVWLDQADTLTFPPAAGAYTRLAYSLPPGVVVEIEELVREP